MQNSAHFNCLSEAMCQELCDAIQSGYDQECVGIVIKLSVAKACGAQVMTSANCHRTEKILWRMMFLWNSSYAAYRKRPSPSSPVSMGRCGEAPATCASLAI